MLRIKVFLLSGIILVWGALSSVGHAQVTNITSSGLGTTISSISPIGVVTITGGTRPGNGTNLFHSFGLFNVGSGDTANFFNNTGLPTTNILSRVTGGNPSNIFGTIQTDPSFGSANLFLINPAGVVFGPSASLNVGGSFHVSTADYVRLTDNVLFNAKPNAGADALLSSAPVAAFGFLPTTDPRSILAGAPRGDIVVQGSQLSVPNDQAISFVGGDITMTGGTLSAPGGQINLASVASPGEVLLPSMQAAPNVDNATFTAMGTINLSQGATLDVSGDGGGTVRIRGGQLVVDNASIFFDTQGAANSAPTAVDINVTGDITLSNSSAISGFVFAGGRGGDIIITGGSLTLTGGSTINTQSFGGTLGLRSAGDITLNVGTLTLGEGSLIFSSAFADGNGGSITAMATDSVNLTDRGTLQTETFSTGNGGNITVTARNFNLNRGGLIDTDTAGAGSAGNINVSVAGTLSLSDLDSFGSPSRITSFTTGSGNTGNISLTVGTLDLHDRASIDILSDIGAGQTGNMRVVATEDITLSNGLVSGGLQILNFSNAFQSVGSLEVIAPTLTLNSGIILTRNEGLGNAGPITLQVGNLSVTGGSRIDSDTRANGRGGDIRVISDVVSLSGTGSGLFSENQGFAGRGGDIQLQARQVELSNGATISVKATGTADAGNILIQAGDSLVMQSSSITSEALQGDGGSITLQVGRLVDLIDSKITTSVSSGVGNGGNITIDPQFVILEGSQILANAFGGNGGNILIVAGVFFADPNSTVSASSTLGINGAVSIQAPITNLSGTLAPLPEEFLQAAALLRAGCAARFQGGNLSSFVVAGRDGVPLEPGGFLPSPLFVESPGSARLAGALLNVPELQVGRSFGEQIPALAALSTGCAL